MDVDEIEDDTSTGAGLYVYIYNIPISLPYKYAYIHECVDIYTRYHHRLGSGFFSDVKRSV